MQRKEEYKVYSLELTKEEKEAINCVRGLVAEIDKCRKIQLFDKYDDVIGEFDSIEEMLENYRLEDVLDELLYDGIKIWEK